jgi:hypothetical protein
MKTPMLDNKMLETPTSQLMIAAEAGEIATWNDTKKTEFVGIFHARVRAARFILEMTAYHIAETAERRKFISQKHIRKLYDEDERRYGRGLHPVDPVRFADPETQAERLSHYGNGRDRKIGGREPKVLADIAEQRAKAVLAELPPLQKAVQIIDPETAKMLDQKDKLLVQGEKLRDAIEKVSEPIVMADLDQKMTIGAFRTMVKNTDKKRKLLLEKMREVGKEGSELEETIAKRLFAGLPGLSDAVVEVIKSHIDRSTALDEVSRRVEEQVRFGDSEAALGLLRHFEQDEATIGGQVKQQFAEAMAKLKLSVTKATAKKDQSARSALS